jgi:hypothetical protein
MDSFVSALCRILALRLFIEDFRKHDICGNAFVAPWRREQLRLDVVPGQSWQRQQPLHKSGCRVALNCVQVALIVIVIALTAVQGMLAIAMRRHAREMEQTLERSKNPAPVDLEKQHSDVW